MKSVDIIVPCYRYAHYLDECVGSVLSQRSVEVRVLIIDDASPDNAPEVAKRLARDHRVQYVRHDVNRGHIATYNEGIAWARAEYTLLLSADDFLLEGALERATALLEAHPSAGFAFGKAIALFEDGSSRTTRTIANLDATRCSRVISGMDFILISGASNIVPTPTAVVRTSLQHAVGGYKPSLPHSGDMEMWLRLAAHADVAVINAEQAVYRQHAASMSRDYRWLSDLQQREAALRSFLSECDGSLKERRFLRKRLFDELGRAAVDAASVAFNEGQSELSTDLRRYARTLSPGVMLSLPWARLSIKRCLGPVGWRSLRSLVPSAGAAATIGGEKQP